jgi:hypothetical protein
LLFPFFGEGFFIFIIGLRSEAYAGTHRKWVTKEENPPARYLEILSVEIAISKF